MIKKIIEFSSVSKKVIINPFYSFFLNSESFGEASMD